MKVHISIGDRVDDMVNSVYDLTSYLGGEIETTDEGVGYITFEVKRSSLIKEMSHLLDEYNYLSLNVELGEKLKKLKKKIDKNLSWDD